MVYLTRSEADTMNFAARMAGMLSAGDTVLLNGDLGVGKSVIDRGVARGLGIEGPMPSPTFTIMIPYEGQKKLYHFDLYRLSDPDEFYAAGLDEFVGGDGIAMVEWPEMAELEPSPCVVMHIFRTEDVNERRIEIENRGVSGYNAEMLADWRMEA